MTILQLFAIAMGIGVLTLVAAAGTTIAVAAWARHKSRRGTVTTILEPHIENFLTEMDNAR